MTTDLLSKVAKNSGFLSLLVWGAGALAWAQDSVPEPIGNNSVQAASPFTDYTAGVVVYVLLVGFLVATLLIGGLLILNLGLLSKRREDRIGGRTPSDVGILKENVWPEEPEVRHMLPAEEDSVGVEYPGTERPDEGDKDRQRSGHRKEVA